MGSNWKVIRASLRGDRMIPKLAVVTQSCVVVNFIRCEFYLISLRNIPKCLCSRICTYTQQEHFSPVHTHVSVPFCLLHIHFFKIYF